MMNLNYGKPSTQLCALLLLTAVFVVCKCENDDDQSTQYRNDQQFEESSTTSYTGDAFAYNPDLSNLATSPMFDAAEEPTMTTQNYGNDVSSEINVVTEGDDSSTTSSDVNFTEMTDTDDLLAVEQEQDEMVAECRRESNYNGDFKDPQESSTELKCFYACAVVKMGVMTEENSVMVLNKETVQELFMEALGENTAMIERYMNVASSCEEEVTKEDNRCDYVYNVITCGIQKLSS